MLPKMRCPNPFLLLAVAVIGLGGGAGCARDHWVVMHDGGAPSALRGAGPVTVSFDYAQLLVGGLNESAFVMSKTATQPDYPKTWADVKGSFEASFIEGIRRDWPPGVVFGAPGSAGVHVVVAPQRLQIGHYYVTVGTMNISSDTLLEAAMTFYVGGQPTDEIEVSGMARPTVFHPSIFQHIQTIGVYIGRNTGRFLHSKA